MRLTEAEKEELLALSRSPKLREDMARVAQSRINPFFVDGKVDADRVIDFLTQYNEFLGHPRKPFAPVIEKNMKL
jgi:hypothetical protein